MAYSRTRAKLYEIIFEADTPSGKAFDVALLVFIVLSILVTVLDSVPTYQEKYSSYFYILEWCFTGLFTIEYILRLYSARKAFAYAKSFFGVVDLLSVLPTYLSVVLVGSQYFMIIRALRLLRIFRVLKMVQFVRESTLLMRALLASSRKIMVFLGAVMIIVVIIGTAMYAIESGKNSGFSSIPVSIYWAIVTLTTVGYGDIAPQTALGQFLSAALMIMGYSIIAVPTGIVSSEMVSLGRKEENISTRVCSECHKEGHDPDAEYCKYCGSEMNRTEES